MIIDDHGDIWIRQSWLDTFIRCPERGRLATVKPEWDAATSDSAFIGTCTHYGIEQVLRGRSPDDIADITEEYARDLLLTEPIKWTKYSTETDIFRNARNCAEAWVREIFPDLPKGGRSEVSFSVPLYVRDDGRTVGIRGTVDYVPTDGSLWDWKTAARDYDVKKTQRNAIQPTIYALAAIKGGLESTTEFDLPLDFHYGIMVRGARKSKTQQFTVTRDQGHIDYAMKRMRGAVDMALNFGFEREWPLVDDHFLCNETWCPWWSICRGAHMSRSDEQVTVG